MGGGPTSFYYCERKKGGGRVLSLYAHAAFSHSSSSCANFFPTCPVSQLIAGLLPWEVERGDVLRAREGNLSLPLRYCLLLLVLGLLSDGGSEGGEGKEGETVTQYNFPWGGGGERQRRSLQGCCQTATEEGEAASLV